MKLITGSSARARATSRCSASRSGATRISISRSVLPEQDAFYERMTGLEWVRALVRLNGLATRKRRARRARADARSI
jgi:ABC-type Na+ transport system ATPase subunit NatA